jgi:hypothetical protein
VADAAPNKMSMAYVRCGEKSELRHGVGLAAETTGIRAIPRKSFAGTAQRRAGSVSQAKPRVDLAKK